MPDMPGELGVGMRRHSRQEPGTGPATLRWGRGESGACDHAANTTHMAGDCWSTLPGRAVGAGGVWLDRPGLAGRASGDTAGEAIYPLRPDQLGALRRQEIQRGVP